MSAVDDADVPMGDAVADAAAADDDDDDTPLMPAEGETARLCVEASLRAMQDGNDALRLCTSVGEPFQSVEDACSRLIPFHVFAASGELSWHVARDDKSEQESKSHPQDGKMAVVSKLSNEECWRRDVDTFSESILEFMNQSSSALVRPTKGQYAGAARPVLSTEEVYLIDRLTCEYARKHFNDERIEQQVNSARISKIENEIRRYEDFIRRRNAVNEAAPEQTPLQRAREP